jgi:hypothetical protein
MIHPTVDRPGRSRKVTGGLVLVIPADYERVRCCDFRGDERTPIVWFCALA